ncbi:extracellular solute-binding protein [Teichococcus aerophilus]|uniref:extracellular solute-binding protein n=1 Tax=Teichococcus aerophilus TaxID=1224513 RepID=UPI001F5051BD|nr:extracellular solute-binding protein [Pseudoroseomonas aerophila]
MTATAWPAAAQSGAQVTLMTYSGIFQEQYTAGVIEPFQAASGHRVQYFAPGTSAQMLGTLRAQKADPQVDVVIMDTTTAALACAEGLVEKITPAEMPVLNQIDAQARTAGGGCGPGVTFDHLVMIYDTKAINPAPTRFMDMANPALRGRVSVSAPPNIQGLVLTAILAHANGGDWRNLRNAIPGLKEIAANAQTFDPKPDGATMILNDQIAFATGWNARSQLYSLQSQGRIGVVLPQEGTAFQINTINIVAGSRNAAAARAFMAHALSAEAQKAFTERLFYGPTNTTAQISPEARARTAQSAEFNARVIPLDWVEMQRVRENWNQRWRREVITAQQ